MIRTGILLLLGYFFLVNLCFPEGDLSFGVDLPQMYRHCKTFEDKDMTPLDFVTDHLLNIDGIFDHHGKNDPQRPHTPVLRHHPVQNIFSLQQALRFSSRLEVLLISLFSYNEPIYLSGFYHKVFHPPAA